VTGESALLTTAEVAVAFAGFASVVTVFRRREHVGWVPGDVLRFQLMIASSLAAVFFALLPFAIEFLGATEPVVWSSASGLLGLYLAVSLARIGRRTRRLTRSEALHPWISGSFGVGVVVALALQALNAVGVVFERELGPYFLGLLYLLVLAGVSFGRMLPLGPGGEGGA
jgi:hypothetical protein